MSVGTLIGSTAKVLHPVVAGFRVVGNKILDPNGKQFVPYGIVLECAAASVNSINNKCDGKDQTGNTATAVVAAAAKDWHANIVRFQVAQEYLFSGPRGSVNAAYLSLIDSHVNQANHLGMVATITLQEEEQKGPAFPTASSTKFWKFMAAHYKNNPDVFFDLYNEPRLPVEAFGSSGTVNDVWNTWQKGGSALLPQGPSEVGTTRVTYVGMQSLVNTVRAQGAKNIIVAEGVHSDESLSGLPAHTLTGGNIAYGIEPNPIPNRTSSEQYTNFGQYAKTWPIMPEAFLDTYGAGTCDPHSPVDLPPLFKYLKSINMGLIFWTPAPGIGIVGTNLNEPTSYPPGATNVGSPQCPYRGSGFAWSKANKIGDGALIMAYFKANSVPLPH
ncbi:MAG: cellulase family glycosylhydrolase [Acidimicrobiaceae bacterium]|nr:cellulase family glycosylhydrolase [Acidimicrobiaceae bacterium]